MEDSEIKTDGMTEDLACLMAGIAREISSIKNYSGKDSGFCYECSSFGGCHDESGSGSLGYSFCARDIGQWKWSLLLQSGEIFALQLPKP